MSLKGLTPVVDVAKRAFKSGGGVKGPSCEKREETAVSSGNCSFHCFLLGRTTCPKMQFRTSQLPSYYRLAVGLEKGIKVRRKRQAQ